MPEKKISYTEEIAPSEHEKMHAAFTSLQEAMNQDLNELATSTMAVLPENLSEENRTKITSIINTANKSRNDFLEKEVMRLPQKSFELLTEQKGLTPTITFTTLKNTQEEQQRNVEIAKQMNLEMKKMMQYLTSELSEKSPEDLNAITPENLVKQLPINEAATHNQIEAQKLLHTALSSDLSNEQYSLDPLLEETEEQIAADATEGVQTEADATIDTNEVNKAIDSLHTKLNEEMYAHESLRQGFMEQDIFHQARIEHWGKNNPGKPPTPSGLSEISLDKLLPEQGKPPLEITAQSGAVFHLNGSDASGISLSFKQSASRFTNTVEKKGEMVTTIDTRTPNRAEKREALAQLLTSLKAQGMSNVTCTSNKPETIRAFYTEARKAGFKQNEITGTLKGTTIKFGATQTRFPATFKNYLTEKRVAKLENRLQKEDARTAKQERQEQDQERPSGPKPN